MHAAAAAPAMQPPRHVRSIGGTMSSQAVRQSGSQAGKSQCMPGSPPRAAAQQQAGRQQIPVESLPAARSELKHG